MGPGRGHGGTEARGYSGRWTADGPGRHKLFMGGGGSCGSVGAQEEPERLARRESPWFVGLRTGCGGTRRRGQWGVLKSPGRQRGWCLGPEESRERGRVGGQRGE